MKKFVSLLLCVLTVFSILSFDAAATDEKAFTPYVVDFQVTTDINGITTESAEPRVSGLIQSYGLALSKSGATLNISGFTQGVSDTVRTGFQDFTIQRKKASATKWENYYEYGDVMVDGYAANLSTTLVVESGYEYRISTKHYAKKNFLMVQKIENTSETVSV